LPVFIENCVIGPTWGNILPEKIEGKWIDQFGNFVDREQGGWFVCLNTDDDRVFYVACDLVKDYVGPQACSSSRSHYVLSDGNWNISALEAIEIRNIASVMNIPIEIVNNAITNLRMTDTERVNESDHDALESFPRGRYYARGGGVHIDGKPCGTSCPQLKVQPYPRANRCPTTRDNSKGKET